MIVFHRQGIVTYPSSNGVQQFLTTTGSYVSINAVNGVIDVAFAHRTTNYLLTETQSVSNAWGPIPSPGNVWLYWDIDTLTGVRSYGFTTLQPIAQVSTPANPAVDQHWFDTGNMFMRVWNGNRWQEKIRVFAAQFDTAAKTFTSVSVLSNQQRFDGTQCGSQGEPTSTGRIIVDNTGRPVTNQQNLFFTTEDDFFINGSPINTIRLEANILTARPVENIAAYQVVTFTDFDTVALASYHDLQTSAIAIASSAINRDAVGSFIIQGVVTNPAWNWATVGQSLWVSETGELTTLDPRVVDAVTYNIGKAPVGRVISRHSIIFDQGLGGKGDKGDSALAGMGIGEAATQFTLGKVKLTVAPADPGSPFVVETTDPRMADARVPLQHIHPATDVHPAPFGVTVNGTLQTTLENLEASKLNKNGDTMVGQLSVPTPTQPSSAVPLSVVKEYVRLDKLGQHAGDGTDTTRVATLDATGKLTLAQVPQISLSDTFTCGSEAEMLTLNAQTGDLAVRTDVHATFILKGTNATQITDWQELLTRPDGVVWVDVISTSSEGLRATGGPVTSSGTITLSLADDIAAIEALQGTGIAHRVGQNAWELKAVDLAGGADCVTGVLPMSYGGTGHMVVNGYLKGNGTQYTVLSNIPGADIQGAVAQSSSTPWTGVTSTPTTLVGYGIADAYTKTQTDALTWNWSSIGNKPSTLGGYGITDVYSKTEITTYLAQKANSSTTLAGYGITDAATSTHNHQLDTLANVNTATKATGDILVWNGSNWGSQSITSASLPTLISGKIFDNTNTIAVKDDNFLVENAAVTTKQFKFSAAGIATGVTRIYNAPNSDGTIALTNGFGASGNWNINAASANVAPWAGITNTPTTVIGYGITDVYTRTETEALSWNWSAVTNTPTTLAGYGIVNAYTKTEINALTWNWSAITSRPTTVFGYGITDAYTKIETNALTWNWSSITGRPSTLAGYGILDASPLVHNHTALNDTMYVKLTDIGNTVASLDITGHLPSAQLPDSALAHTYYANSDAEQLGIVAVRGDMVIRLDQSKTYVLRTAVSTAMSDWAQIVTPVTVGGAGTVTSVAITAPPAGITVTGSPITGNGTFTLALADDLAALENLTSAGYPQRIADGVWSISSTIPTSNISGVLPVANGGTGASTPAAALTALGGAPLTGTGASGTWNINISGNAASATTVSNGVYTTGAYADPAWITSLNPSKVVATWTGSTNIGQVADTVTFGQHITQHSGSLITNTVAPTILHTFSINVFASGKYTIQAKNQVSAMLVDVYVTVDDIGDVFINQVGTGASADVAAFSATLNTISQNVELYVTPTLSTPTRFVFTTTLFQDI